MAVPNWVSIPLNSGWTNFSAVNGGRWELFRYQLYPSTKKVIINGIIVKSTVPVQGEIIATLPSIIKPDYGFNEGCVGDLGSSAKVQFDSNGNIIYLEGALNGRTLNIRTEYSIA